MKLFQFVIAISVLLGSTLFGADSYTPPISSSVVSAENIVRLVFMGKTGAGKSTSINSFYNYAKGISWDTFPKLFPIKTPYQTCNVPHYADRNSEDHRRGQLEAVTQEPSEYTAKGDNLVVNLVDCPGVADPRGVEKDAEITKEIAEFLDKAGEFNALCIVIPNTVNRATAEEKYLVEQIKTIIPKESQDRIFLIISHTTRPSRNVLEFAQSVGLPTQNVFAFDNFALTQEGHIAPGDDEDIAAEVEGKWNMSKRNFDRLITKAKALGKFSTEPMQRIGEIKRLTSEKIFTALNHVEAIEDAEFKLIKAQAEYELAASAHGYAMSSAESAQQAMTLAKAEKDIADALDAYDAIDEWEKYTTIKHNTVCWNCRSLCHLTCGLEEVPDTCLEDLAGCSCFTDGHCTACKNHCTYAYHRHRHWYEEKVTSYKERDGVRTRQSSATASYGVMSSNFDRKQSELAEKEKEKCDRSDIVERVKASLEKMKREKDTLQHQIVELYIELSGVSMGSISFHIGEYYDKRISNAEDAAKRLRLQRDRVFYIEQVDLYKQKTDHQ